MTTTALLSVASSICAVLFAIIIALLSWMGNRLYSKLEEMNTEAKQMSKDSIHQAGLFYEDLNGIDKRLTVVETECKIHHSRRVGDPNL